MSMLWSLCAICGAPLAALGLAALLYWADRYEKEPLRWLIGLFLWGGLFATTASVVFTLLGESLARFVLPPTTVEGLSSVFLAPLVEESWKGVAVLAALLWNRDEIHSLMDGLLYGAVVGLGFEGVENMLYLLVELTQNGPGAMAVLMLLRVGLFGFTHGLFTAMVGLGVAVARMYITRLWAWLAIPAGWVMAVLLHMLHNLLVGSGLPACFLVVVSDWGGLGFILSVVVLALRRERAWLARYLREEWAAGRITEAQYVTALSLARRMRAIRRARTRGQARLTRSFYEALSELAYLKAQARRTPEDVRIRERIQALQERVWKWSSQAEVG